MGFVDSTVDQSDRQAAAYHYSGIAADEAGVFSEHAINSSILDWFAGEMAGGTNIAADEDYNFDPNAANEWLTIAVMDFRGRPTRRGTGQLDAYFYAAGWPVSAMVQLATTKGMELHSFT